MSVSDKEVKRSAKKIAKRVEELINKEDILNTGMSGNKELQKTAKAAHKKMSKKDAEKDAIEALKAYQEDAMCGA